MLKVWKVRGLIDGMLAATIGTLAISIATLASAQSGPTKTPAERAIDAAVPIPEPANVMPPSPADFVAQAKALANGETRPADAKISDAKTPDAKTSDANPSDAKPEAANPVATVAVP